MPPGPHVVPGWQAASSSDKNLRAKSRDVYHLHLEEHTSFPLHDADFYSPKLDVNHIWRLTLESLGIFYFFQRKCGVLWFCVVYTES